MGDSTVRGHEEISQRKCQQHRPSTTALASCSSRPSEALYLLWPCTEEPFQYYCNRYENNLTFKLFIFTLVIISVCHPVLRVSWFRNIGASALFEHVIR